MIRTGIASMTLLVALLIALPMAICAEEPIATIAVISNPYITTLLPDQIKDERGSVRDFLATTAAPSMQKTVELVNQVKPDALVVLGSLTWAGTDDEFQAFAKYLDQIKTTKFVVPGHWDKRTGSLNGYKRHFGTVDASQSVKTVNGVRLAFAEDLHGNPDGATQRLQKQLSSDDGAKAVLLFASKESEFARSKLTADHKTFWKFVEDGRVAARFDPTRYSHQLLYEDSLPIWTVGSTAWSTRGAITLVRVFADRVEMSQMADPTQPAFSLTVPNPVNAPRMKPAADDPYGCPSYSADLAQKPDFTFALVSDPQFDRERNRATLISKAEASIAELNRLNPSMVFVAGDLVNNNLPEEWEMFKQIFAKLKPPRHVAPGNHDVLFNYNFVEEMYLSAAKKNPEYAKLVVAAVASAAKEGFTGSTALYEKYMQVKPQRLVEHKDTAFIIVSFLTMRADADQIKFLREQLERTKAKRHVFVVAHYPSLPAFGNNVQPQLGGDEVLSLLQEYRVTGYLFGHRHRNGFRQHERTAHVLTDNMGTIHLLHVFPDRIVIGRKGVGAALYEKITIPSPRG